eukprot:scaffold35722_cov32-Tisochrysis_lutea.AAC.2
MASQCCALSPVDVALTGTRENERGRRHRSNLKNFFLANFQGMKAHYPCYRVMCRRHDLRAIEMGGRAVWSDWLRGHKLSVEDERAMGKMGEATYLQIPPAGNMTKCDARSA